ncbi:hypothetical protein HRR90_007619 [Exophiala dermatitidis]|nr:hypothetical protein HRR74_008353 [Exophiala dermatitidis]KAJ4533632.1 hypothetical protein HRR77_008393 [Exophiala dermatitidis]KAJ4560369.1 hypothetical protein HRR79_008057 [Exophiala dermatitidis]KAJ4563797.1 hypothetical protein HRR81_008340 [Exophiala dermatitidis]KAJ4566858.1 hypothetical protein HRR82_008428 [Exophiala dermatitidis]
MLLYKSSIIPGYLLMFAFNIVDGQYTGWGMLPACGQQCFSDALLTSVTNCDNFSTDKTLFRACICTTCAYVEKVKSCFAASHDCGGEANVAAALTINNAMFCNGSVQAEAQMSDGALIWNCGPNFLKPASITSFQLPTTCGSTSAAVSASGAFSK